MMTREELIGWLSAPEAEAQALFDRALQTKRQTIGNKVYLRGLIELSNRCAKDCLYCGIRRSNGAVSRYEQTDQQVFAAAEYAWKQGYGSVVIQAGERQDEVFTARVERLIRGIKALSENELGITLSLGEQSFETYCRWREAGAHRYLLRIESSTPELYARIHPADHRFEDRLAALDALRSAGFQVGTGVMIGLPEQTVGHLADDLLFFKRMDIDMCGMGPYIEHPDTPLAALPSDWTPDQRFDLALRMIALLRINMPDINIASTTALHALRPDGRERGIAAGANVMMPTLTPPGLRGNYKLYANKPLHDMDLSGFDVGYGLWGDSLHFSKR